MRLCFCFSIVMGVLINTSALAQTNSNIVVAPGSTITKTVDPGAGVATTIVQTPGVGVTTTTKVTTPTGKSALYNLKDGTKLEVDYDNSVFIVYPDGARVTAPDGVHTLPDTSVVTVKDGKKVP